MSLILEALRKLEREKPATQRTSTVLLAPLAWPGRPRRRWLGVAAGATLVVAAAAAGHLYLRGAPRPATPEAASVAAALPIVSSQPTALPAVRPTPARARMSQPSPPHQAGGNGSRAQPSSARPEFRLTAIGDQEGISVAVLNDRVMRVGDALLGARIVRIGAAEVELEREADGRRFTVGF